MPLKSSEPTAGLTCLYHFLSEVCVVEDVMLSFYFNSVVTHIYNNKGLTEL